MWLCLEVYANEGQIMMYDVRNPILDELFRRADEKQ
jgi:hypothetical protein